MKAAIRSTVATLLVVLLAVFSFWRNADNPNLAPVTNAVKQAVGATKNVVSEFIPDGFGTQQDEDKSKKTDKKKIIDSGSSLQDSLDGELEDTVTNGLISLADSVDVSSFGMTGEEAKDAMTLVMFSHPELFYVGADYQISYSGSTVSAIKPTYTVEKSKIPAMTAFYNSEISKITAGIPEESTDFDKILYIHDYLIKNYTYDYTYTIRDAYTFFKEGTGVCQAYMLATIALCNAVGVESIPVVSDPMNHAWNLVKVDGSWYHYDVTWDDNMSISTFVSYTYFLQSETGLATTDSDETLTNRHHDWTSQHKAENEQYDDAIWRSAISPIGKTGNTYYVVLPAQSDSKSGTIYSGTDLLNLQPYFDIAQGYWMAGATGYYPGCYSGLVIDKGILYCNNGNTIYGINLATGKLCFLNGPALGYGKCIYGLYGVNNGKLSFAAADTPSATAYQVTEIPI